MEYGIPQDFIDELVNRVDIVDLIDQRVPLKRAGKNYSACCPFHEERTPSFTVSPDKQFYHCFGCGAHGTAIGFLMQHEGLSFLEAIEELAQSVGMTVPRRQKDRKVVAIQESLGSLLEQASQYYQRQLREHPKAQLAVNYLKQRGLSGETARAFGIGFAPPGWDNLLQYIGATQGQSLVNAGLVIRNEQGRYYDRFRNRIMFPIRNRRGKTIGFGGRILEDTPDSLLGKEQARQEPKYLNSPETPLFHKGTELYGLYECRQHSGRLEQIIVVEGYMDVVALSQAGIWQCVATLGTAATRQHVEKLFRSCSSIVFCFDGDNAGRQAAWRALENTLPLLQGQRQARFLFLPEGQDPDSMVRNEGRDQFEALLKQALPLSEYFLQSLQENIDLSHIDGRVQLLEKARPYLESIQSPLYREMLEDHLEKLTHTSRQIFTSRGKTRTEQVPSDSVSTEVGRSPIRGLIAWLLHSPELAHSLPLEEVKQIDLPGIPLLTQLTSYIMQQNQTSCAAILEHFRSSEHFSALSRLAAWQPYQDTELTSVDSKEEFRHLFKRLLQQHYEQQLNRLLNLADKRTLNDEEKAQLSALMHRLKR